MMTVCEGARREKMSEDHAEFIKRWYKDVFEHGYKHGYEDGVREGGGKP